MSEISSLVCLVVGNDEVHPSRHEPMSEDLVDSLEREFSGCFSKEEVEKGKRKMRRMKW